MHLVHLSLTNFRNYTRLELDLQARIHVLQGENAQGKSNLLEAIYYLATTKSPRTATERELIHWAAESGVIPFARARADFMRGERARSIECTLVKERLADSTATNGALRRQILLDGVPRRAMDVVGQLHVVLFMPEDIALVSGAPAGRRHYLDVSLCQIDLAYCRTLARYNRVVTQRNALLRQIREGQAQPAQLDYWDEQAAELGAYLLARRLWAVRQLNAQVSTLHPELTEQRERLELAYCASLTNIEDGSKAALSQGLRRSLQSRRRDEIARATTLCGPHRDDLRFAINGADATIYGSRGQQRTVALALKLAEVALMEGETQETPILLLDDILSELDQRRTHLLLQTLSRAQQVLLTTTDSECPARAWGENAVYWRVHQGAIFGG
jgi:DNA replication and repair protein RecF